jgi:hypothetical protein
MGRNNQSSGGDDRQKERINECFFHTSYRHPELELLQAMIAQVMSAKLLIYR